jgi:hypothetical protein
MFPMNDRQSVSGSAGRWSLGLRVVLSALFVGIIWLEFSATKAHGFKVCERQCAFGDAACAAAIVNCETKIHAYNIYMAHMGDRLTTGERVTTHQFPAVHREILGPRYPQVNLTTVRFGFADRQRPGNATTDCNTIYFNDADIVEKLRNASRLSNYFWYWLLHEVTHTEQCPVFGGREAYAKRWWDEMEAAAYARGRTINFNQSPEALANEIGGLYSEVHDAMPMELQADNKANAVRTALRACCISNGGSPIRPMLVSGIADRSDAGSSTRRILTAQVTNGDPPFTTKWWIKSPGDTRFIEQPQNLVNGLDLLWTPSKANPEVVKTAVQTRRRWNHEIQVEVSQQSTDLGRGKATRTITISELVSITPLDKGRNIPKLPDEVPPSKFPGGLPTPVPSKPIPSPGPSPTKPPIGP